LRPRRAIPLTALLVAALAAPVVRAAPAGHGPSVMAGAPPAGSSPAPAEQPSYYSVWPEPTGKPVAPPLPPAPRPRRSGLMIGGWTAFGVVWLGTAGFTALHIALDGFDPWPSPCTVDSPCYPDPETPRQYRLRYIPLIGPFLAIPAGRTPATRFQIASPGVLQVVALALGVVGTVLYVRDGRVPRVVDADGFKLGARLRLGVAPTRLLDGGAVTLGGRF
jgi:hypothetical protein